MKIVVGDFMERMKREDYLSTLRNFKDQQIIKVITGIRRGGKSTLLKLFERKWNRRKSDYINQF